MNIQLRAFSVITLGRAIRSGISPPMHLIEVSINELDRTIGPIHNVFRYNDLIHGALKDEQ